jgi:predicted DNA-binding transcriptional regulator AlpA
MSSVEFFYQEQDAAPPPKDVALSPYVNERFPAWEELLSAHDVARLTRRPRWVLASLILLRQFPRKRRYHGRGIGWLRSDVLSWLTKDLEEVYGNRICESTGTSELKEAVMVLARRIDELRSSHFYGARTPRTFREAATRFLEENQHKRSLERDARALASLDPYLGELQLQRVHSGTLQSYIRDRLKDGTSPGTINRDLAVVRRILTLCARLWRDESDRPWLDTAPLIQMQRHPNKRTPYPLSMEEQRVLFSELSGHLARMALFKVNTGTREHEVCGLKWDWEVRVPELETSVFIIPAEHVKNGQERYVVLNRTAKLVIEACRVSMTSLCSPRRAVTVADVPRRG